MIEVGIIMGSQSDLPIMQEAAQVLKDFGIEFEITVVSAHRTPERMFEYGKARAFTGLKSDYCWCWWGCAFTRNDGIHHATAGYWRSN
jgi:hypothetical protein